jgi:predicted O-methyltransferase YrrM
MEQLHCESPRARETGASLYPAVSPLPFDPEGWLARGNECAFDHLLGVASEMSPRLRAGLQELRPLQVTRALEIGSYKGLSSRYLAERLPDGALLYCADPWRFREGLFHTFLSNIRHAGLEGKIVPVRATSAEAAEILRGLTFDLIYIDGSHETEEVVFDCWTWYPRLGPGGLLCGDDYTMASVALGVEAFAREAGLTVRQDAERHFWWIV